MHAIILFQIGNVDIALDIFQRLASIYNHFTTVTIFVSILESLNSTILLELLEQIKIYYPNTDYLVQTHINKGMDIGPFLLQFKYLIDNNMNYDVFLKIHTKTNLKWRNELVDPLIDNIDVIKNQFVHNTEVGLIGAKKWVLPLDRINKTVIMNMLNKLNIQNHYYDIIDYNQLQRYRDEMIIDPAFYIKYNNLPLKSLSMATSHFMHNGIHDNTIIPHPSLVLKYHTIDTFFIGGTIFWAKYDIFLNFLKKYPLDTIIYNALEEGYTINDTETVVHAMERFLCLIPYIMNNNVYGIV